MRAERDRRSAERRRNTIQNPAPRTTITTKGNTV
jgi:hypothetical protein